MQTDEQKVPEDIQKGRGGPFLKCCLYLLNWVLLRLEDRSLTWVTFTMSIYAAGSGWMNGATLIW